MLKGNYSTKRTNAVIGQEKSATYSKTLISLQKNIFKKSTYQQGLLGQIIPIEAPRKPIRYGHMEELSASVHGFTDTEETMYYHILQDVHCLLYRRRSKDVLRQENYYVYS